MSAQPKYSRSSEKRIARQVVFDAFRYFSKKNFIPTNRTYWTLCNDQTNSQSEINQILKCGLISSKRQFVGVDRDDKIISQNRIVHPEATWYCGEWNEVVSYERNFNPALIYLDTTGIVQAGNVPSLISTTMAYAPHQTLLVVNAMCSNPYSHEIFEPEALLEEILKIIPHSLLTQWKIYDRVYPYSSTGRTRMVNFFFWRT